MNSFEELGLAPHLVEALVSEGIETPTALQKLAIPVLRRGTSAVLQAAPGAGLLVAYGAPLLDRLQPEGGQPTAIVLTPERERARSLALSLANPCPRHGSPCRRIRSPMGTTRAIGHSVLHLRGSIPGDQLGEH